PAVGWVGVPGGRLRRGAVADGKTSDAFPFEKLKRKNPRAVPIAESDVVGIVADRPHRLDPQWTGFGGADHRQHQRPLRRLGILTLFLTASGTRAGPPQLGRRPVRFAVIIPTDSD